MADVAACVIFARELSIWPDNKGKGRGNAWPSQKGGRNGYQGGPPRSIEAEKALLKENGEAVVDREMRRSHQAGSYRATRLAILLNLEPSYWRNGRLLL